MSRCIFIRDSTEVITTFSLIDVLSMHGLSMHPFKAKSGNEVITKIIRDDGRCPKNLHTDRRKEFYNSNMQKTLEEAQHQPLFYVFRNEGFFR